MNIDDYSCYKFNFISQEELKYIVEKVERFEESWEDLREENPDVQLENFAEFNALINLTAKFLCSQVYQGNDHKAIWRYFQRGVEHGLSYCISETY